MKIRTVQAKDIDACHLIEQHCFTQSEAASLDSIKERATVYPSGFIVAELDHRVVGMINSGATDSDDITDEAFKKLIGHREDGRNIVIFSVSVAPKFQGKKIASRLMSRFVERSRELNKEKILLLCKTDLIPFYERLGFTLGGISTSTHGGFEWHEMIYTLKNTNN
ncbi:acetyltransferase (GNAT family protein) [Desulforapulum autotrophicum HRM2]|uniref:Acetyltransferase (GNAT family protein) n=1 Tax=Desulforapulum autotrophicum (strain ATCC 43914 / DSM 3382 / VKM B-1955 / HRM2) TaxID=177437 RepID=C0QJX3_DESAH|nr:GNAT family N-acetyltransferase [Desulforapulum autotrophicum]ACN15999.1 acetyltransferase (GNAT family protein) [Desulforapulum autotrophicum HRM2]